MKIKCPKCNALYIYSEDFIEKKGGRIQCFKCKTFMQVGKDGSITIEGEEKVEGSEKPQFLNKLSEKGKKRYEDYLTKPDFREYLPLAEELVEIGEYRTALEVCEKLLSRFPNSIAGKSVKLRILSAMKEYEGADELAKELEKQTEGNPVVLIALIEYYKGRNLEKAQKYIEMLELIEPDSKYLAQVKDELRELKVEEVGGEVEEKEVVNEGVKEEEDIEMFWDEEERSETELSSEEVEGFSPGEGVSEEVEEGFPEGIEGSEEAKESGFSEDTFDEKGEEILPETTEEEIIEEVKFEDVGEIERGTHEESYPQEETSGEERPYEESAEEGYGVGEEVVEEVDFEVSEEMDFSDVLKDVEHIEETPSFEEEVVEELLSDETELVEEVSPELIEEKEKKKVFPYAIIGTLLLLILLISGAVFYFLVYEYPGDVARASPQKIVKLSKGIFGLSVNKVLSKEAFEKGKIEFFKDNYKESLNKFRVSAFYNPKDPSALSMYACLLTKERGADFNLIQTLLNRANSLGGGLHYTLANACVDIYGGEGKRTFDILKSVGDKATNDEVFYALLFETLKREGSKESADFLKKMVEVSRLPSSESALLYFKTASVLEGLSPDDAREYYMRAMELSEDPAIKLGYARFLFKNYKDYTSAQSIVKSVIEGKEVSAEVMGSAYKLMGEIEEFQGDRLSAADYFIKSFEKNPSESDVFFKGILLLIEARKFENVRKILTQNVDKLGTSADYYYFMGRCDYGQGRFMSAVENFKKAISINRKVEYLAYLARAYIKAGGFDLGEGVISELETINPNSTEVKLLRALMKVEKGDVDGALNSLVPLYAELKDEPDFHYLFAYAYFKKGNYAEAEKEGLRAWEMGGKAEYAILLAQVYFNMKKFGNAVKFASLGISKSPDTPEGYIIRAKSYEAMGDMERALSDYDSALHLSSDNVNFIVEYAMILIKIGDYSKAENILKEGLKVDPNNPRIYYALGKASYNQGKLNEAISYFVRAEEMQPNIAEAQYYLGMIYLHEGVYNKAYEYFYKAVQNEGNNPVYLYYLSKVLFINNRAFDALGYVEKAIEYSPGYDDAWVLKGEIKAFLGKNDEAKECFIKAVKLNSRNVNGWIQLAEIAYADGNLKDAFNYLSNAERYAGKNVEVNIARGRIYYKGREFSSALQEFEKAMKIAPNDPRPYYYIGLVYRRLGNRDEAEKMFKRALDLGLSGKEREELARETGTKR